MAVDLVVTPLSAFLAGDFVTDALASAWADGRDAVVAHIDGTTTAHPVGVPVGGPDAGRRREVWLAQMPRYLATLPYDIEGLGWDERAAPADRRWSLEHARFAALCDAARPVLEPSPGFFRVLLGQYSTASHLINARVFVDRDFDKPFAKGEVRFGSLAALERELSALDEGDIGDAAVRAVFRDAIAVARAENLPLVVDE